MRQLGRAAAIAAAIAAAMMIGASASGSALAAQDSAAAHPATPAPPAVGDVAPDFTLPGATAAGPSGPIRLSDLRGKTVVLAFFFKARTKG